jgi:hypothetical protein
MNKEHNMANNTLETSITVQWRNKNIARQNLTFMRTCLNGEFKTLVKNSCKHVREFPGQVSFTLIGQESRKALDVLLGMTGGKLVPVA